MFDSHQDHATLSDILLATSKYDPDICFKVWDRQRASHQQHWEEMFAHKELLAAVSPVFKSQFFPGDSPDKRESGGKQLKSSDTDSEILELFDTSVEAFNILIDFIYAGEISLSNLSLQCIVEVFVLASKYKIGNLWQASKDQVIRFTQPEVVSSHGSLHIAKIVSTSMPEPLSVPTLYEVISACSEDYFSSVKSVQELQSLASLVDPGDCQAFCLLLANKDKFLQKSCSDAGDSLLHLTTQEIDNFCSKKSTDTLDQTSIKQIKNIPVNSSFTFDKRNDNLVITSDVPDIEEDSPNLLDDQELYQAECSILLDVTELGTVTMKAEIEKEKAAIEEDTAKIEEDTVKSKRVNDSIQIENVTSEIEEEASNTEACTDETENYASDCITISISSPKKGEDGNQEYGCFRHMKFQGKSMVFNGSGQLVDTDEITDEIDMEAGHIKPEPNNFIMPDVLNIENNKAVNIKDEYFEEKIMTEVKERSIDFRRVSIKTVLEHPLSQVTKKDEEKGLKCKPLECLKKEDNWMGKLANKEIDQDATIYHGRKRKATAFIADKTDANNVCGHSPDVSYVCGHASCSAEMKNLANWLRHMKKVHKMPDVKFQETRLKTKKAKHITKEIDPFDFDIPVLKKRYPCSMFDCVFVGDMFDCVFVGDSCIDLRMHMVKCRNKGTKQFIKDFMDSVDGQMPVVGEIL